MTPFEKAEKKIRDLAIRLNLYALLQQTVDDTKDLSEEEAEQVWQVILLMLEASDLKGDAN